MGRKKDRLDVIRRIISEELIGSQDELIKRLGAFGIKATQSTLSRDFKSLNVAKTPHVDRGYVYVLGETVAPEEILASSDLNDSILSLRFSGNLAVIATKAGFASAISVIIDGMKIHEVIGTVAGDNTIMLILREGGARAAVVERLLKRFPTLQQA